MSLDARSPQPRDQASEFQEWVYDVGERHYLPRPEITESPEFHSVLERRRTRRSFSHIDSQVIGALLWFTGKTWSRSPTGRRWEHRATPSAGGKHPVDMLLQFPSSPNQIWYYDPYAHLLARITTVDETALEELWASAVRVVPPESGIVVWHAAVPERTLSVYQHGDSLIWRDAGALTCTTCLVAEALELNCCPLGITGEDHLSNALLSGENVVGVGGCLVGSRRPAS